MRVDWNETACWYDYAFAFSWDTTLLGPLEKGQTMTVNSIKAWPNACNISTQHLCNAWCVTHVCPLCRNILQDAGWCWSKFENGKTFVATFFECCKMTRAFGQLVHISQHDSTMLQDAAWSVWPSISLDNKIMSVAGEVFLQCVCTEIKQQKSQTVNLENFKEML